MPETNSDFKDAVLQTTLVAVRRRRRLRTGVRLGLGMCLLVVTGWVALSDWRESEPIAEETGSTPVEIGTPPKVEIAMVKSKPLPLQFVVRTDAARVESYIVRTGTSARGVGKASDSELLAALDGQSVILATDRSGRSELRILD